MTTGDSWPAPPYFPNAACRADGVNVNDWFPDPYRQATTAKKVCAECPHQLDCAEFAIGHPQLLGVWGGLSEAERRRARQRPLVPLPVVGDDRCMTAVVIEPASTNGHALESTALEPDRGTTSPKDLGDPVRGRPREIKSRSQIEPDRGTTSPKDLGDPVRGRPRENPTTIGISEDPEAARKRRRNEADARRRAAKQAKQATARAATAPSGPTVTVGSEHDTSLTGRDKLGPIFNALMVAGASVVHLEVDLGGETWCITRTATNGAHL